MEQRVEQYNDLLHALQVMHKISSSTGLPDRMCQAYLLESGAMRFVKIPKVVGTSKSDQFKIYPAASPVILHHTA